jgi:hypothetical protein
MSKRRRLPALAGALLAFWPHLAAAYTAAGDRNFPATILLPQAAPSDEFYIPFSTQPVAGGRATDLSLVYGKTLTERLGLQFEDGYDWLQQNGGPTRTGWQNLKTTVKYLAVLDPVHEGLLSFGVAREWGGTGASRVGAAQQGATTPGVYFAKGLGDLDLGYLRPLALTGQFGYQFADAPPRPDKLVTGVAVEYSLPYLESRVEAVGLPGWLRATTPLVETFVTTPTSNRGTARTAAVVAPGLSYAGEGWEFVVEALVPANRAAGTGLGVTAQFHLALDFLLPYSLGRPLFSTR